MLRHNSAGHEGKKDKQTVWITPNLEELKVMSLLFGVSIDELIAKPINEQQNDWFLSKNSPFQEA